MASANPARLMGLSSRIGTVEQGLDANLILFEWNADSRDPSTAANHHGRTGCLRCPQSWSGLTPAHTSLSFRPSAARAGIQRQRRTFPRNWAWIPAAARMTKCFRRGEAWQDDSSQLELVDLFGYAPYNFAVFQDSGFYGLSDT